MLYFRVSRIRFRFFEKEIIIIIILVLAAALVLSRTLDSAAAQIRVCKFDFRLNQTIVCKLNPDQSHATNPKRIPNTSAAKITLDSSGIPVVDYGYIRGTYVGHQRNPVTISQKAIYYYDLFKKTPNMNTSQALNNSAHWLYENAQSHGNYSILEYKFPYPPYNMTSPWRSSLAQGQGIEALLDGYRVTGEKKYLDTAKMLLNSFFVEVKNGGVTFKTPTNGWWYEEYAANASKESRVLNGMMYTLLSMHDYYNYTHAPEAKYLFDKGVLALDRTLPRYDNNGYSNYDVLGTPASIQYHHIHVDLLGRLFNITKDEIFKAFHDRWGNYNMAKSQSKNPGILNRKVNQV